MKYYLISNATEEKEIGKTYPQCKFVPEGYTLKWFDETNSMTKLNNREFPTSKPDLIFELKDDAILTDILSVGNLSAKGFLVNQKVKKVLEKLNLLNHQYFHATLFANKQMHNYFWLHFKKDDLNGIDFKKSSFIEADIIGHKIRDVNINSLNEFQCANENRLDDFNSLIIASLALTFDYKSLDMLFFPNILMSIICSENVINQFESKNITGYHSKEIIVH